MAVLLPIWSTKCVTANRVRQRIGAVMKWAVAQRYRDDSPAGDAISAALSKAAVRKQHMLALPHAEVGAALARVKGSGAYLNTMLAFESLVLVAARSREVRNARWEQIDRGWAVWTIAVERMKAGREHRVPLSPRALGVLRDRKTRRTAQAGAQPFGPDSVRRHAHGTRRRRHFTREPQTEVARPRRPPDGRGRRSALDDYPAPRRSADARDPGRTRQARTRHARPAPRRQGAALSAPRSARGRAQRVHSPIVLRTFRDYGDRFGWLAHCLAYARDRELSEAVHGPGEGAYRAP